MSRKSQYVDDVQKACHLFLRGQQELNRVWDLWTSEFRTTLTDGDVASRDITRQDVANIMQRWPVLDSVIRGNVEITAYDMKRFLGRVADPVV